VRGLETELGMFCSKGAELASQMELGLFKAPDEPQTPTADIHSIYFHLGSATVRPTVTDPAQGADRSRDPMKPVRIKLYS
jgi:hypothetical protein